MQSPSEGKVDRFYSFSFVENVQCLILLNVLQKTERADEWLIDEMLRSVSFCACAYHACCSI